MFPIRPRAFDEATNLECLTKRNFLPINLKQVAIRRKRERNDKANTSSSHLKEGCRCGSKQGGIISLKTRLPFPVRSDRWFLGVKREHRRRRVWETGRWRLRSAGKHVVVAPRRQQQMIVLWIGRFDVHYCDLISVQLNVYNPAGVHRSSHET